MAYLEMCVYKDEQQTDFWILGEFKTKPQNITMLIWWFKRLQKPLQDPELIFKVWKDYTLKVKECFIVLMQNNSVV